MHEHGIVHRDFKTQNIFISDGILKIGDLGFSKQQDILTSVLGTGLYMAPEIYSRKPYTNKADIWALGVVFYQMLFGTYPFYAEKEKVLIQMINFGRK